MSELRPVYIHCASGTQAQTDCLVQRYGDLVQILGHPSMEFTPQDALDFAAQLERIAETILHETAHDPA